MVLSKKEERDLEQATLKAESREDMQQAVLVKMKSVTNADESVCIALLEDHKYVRLYCWKFWACWSGYKHRILLISWPPLLFPLLYSSRIWKRPSRLSFSRHKNATEWKRRLNGIHFEEKAINWILKETTIITLVLGGSGGFGWLKIIE